MYTLASLTAMTSSSIPREETRTVVLPGRFAVEVCDQGHLDQAIDDGSLGLRAGLKWLT